MEPSRFVGSFLFVIMGSVLGLSEAHHQFYVGGRDGWVLKPSEDYNHWAERNRFQVHDTLIFKYNKGSDSVLVVKKEDYYSCNTKNPIQSLTDGNSVFKFDNSGPYFFISGYGDNCNKGQKLIIVVLAVRHKTTPPSPPPHDQFPPLAPPPIVAAPALPPLALTPGTAPPKSGSESVAGSVWLVLGATIGVGSCAMMFGSFF